MASANQAFLDLYEYNAWANAKVFAMCRDLDAARLEAVAPGTYGSIGDTLTHLVGVEDAYLTMLQDRPLGTAEGRDAYFAHDVTWFIEQGAQVGQAYLALLPTFDDSRLESALAVPWFDFPLTKREGLYQVLAHSAQHRAQVFSVLGSAGLDVPDIDYVVLVRERLRPGAA